MVVYMEEEVYRVKAGSVAILDCSVDPKPVSVVWRKGEEKRVDKRILINNKKYYGAGPSSPALVIRLVEKRDEAYYQCTANDTDTTGNIEIEIQGDAVPLEVDSDEDRSSNTHRTQRSQSLSASGAGGSYSDINIRSSASSQDWQRESPRTKSLVCAGKNRNNLITDNVYLPSDFKVSGGEATVSKILMEKVKTCLSDSLLEMTLRNLSTPKGRICKQTAESVSTITCELYS
ncbi:uncharacterized protein LOC110463557 [Mizuhopecten yessoensis]|uniref:uncharacterized protein LOC110463557 n=1 Tax=Mizuhopecten yessoensis TaxID=6573 RepID=UPI000B45EFCC|nr:uncharacterized protein LOC110463557 [Mizuhopecten yessoensis]